MPEGIIVKALSGYYYVMPVEDNGVPSVEGSAVQCRARGIFRKRGTSPLVGDRVSYMLTENGEGTVDEIRKRETELIRPPVANVSLAVLVFSVKEPDMNLNLLDKFLVHIEQAGLDALIVLTKLDLADPAKDTVAEVKALYEQVGYEVISTSSRTGEGSELLRDRLAGKISVFSGQSGVGKSSMLNALMPGLTLETNAISMRLGRGNTPPGTWSLFRWIMVGLLQIRQDSANWTFWRSVWRNSPLVSANSPSLQISANSEVVPIHMNQAVVCLRPRRKV